MERKERRVKLDNILSIVREKYPKYKWNDWEDFVDIASHTDDFCTVLESVLENTENILDEDIAIEKEISFSSEEDVYCQVYVCNKFNINRMFLNID